MKKLVTTLLLFIVCFGSAQMTVDLSWNRSIGSINSGNENVKASAVDAAGNLFIGGQAADITDFDPLATTYTLNANYQGYFAKYSPTGTLIWAKTLLGTSSSEVVAIDVDATGNVYIAGYFNGGYTNFDPTASNYTIASQGSDMYFAKYDMNGAFQWAYAIGDASANFNIAGLKVDAAGDFVIAGGFYAGTTLDFNPASTNYTIATSSISDAFIAKYNSSGFIQWGFSFGNPTASDYIYGIDLDATNNIFVTGSFQGVVDFDPSNFATTHTAVAMEDAFIAKYSPSGNFSWAKGFGGANNDNAYKVVIDGSGDAVITGITNSPVFDLDPASSSLSYSKIGTGSFDMIFGKYSGANGNMIWGQNTGGNGDNYAYSMATDAQNNIYLTGTFSGLSDFDFTAATQTLLAMTSGGGDVFLGKYNTNGALLYANNLGGGTSVTHSGNFIFVNSTNQINLVGEFEATLDVDFTTSSNTVTAIGGTDIFFSKYTQCITPGLPVIAVNSITLCANGVASLSVASGNLNSGTNWEWTSVVCASSAIGTGPSVTVAPVFFTEYFVRGVGGCSMDGPCASASVYVTTSKDIVGSVTHSTLPVSGQVVLYRYEGPLTKWDSVTYQNINASGIYTFNAVNSGSFILMALPTDNTLQTTYSPNAITWKGAAVFGHGCITTTSLNVNVQAINNSSGGPGIFMGKLTEGIGYGQRGGSIAPGNPIKGVTVKGGRNPGGDIVAQGRTNSAGEFTLSNLPLNIPGEDYFIIVDIPGIDTNGTYHHAIVTGSLQYSNLNFVADSDYVKPFSDVSIRSFVKNKLAFTIYPNPAKEILTIRNTSSDSKIKMEVIDINGRNLLSESLIFSNYENERSLPISSLESGIYFIILTSDNFIVREKIIIKH